jgi:hypothetical protein
MNIYRRRSTRSQCGTMRTARTQLRSSAVPFFLAALGAKERSQPPMNADGPEFDLATARQV